MKDSMPTLIQINATANSGSTGRIAEQINAAARSQGWRTFLAFGRRMEPAESELIHVGNRLQVYEHYAEHRLFDNDGLASRIATKKFIKRIKDIGPDIIHLHNIHDHWLNYKLFFEYLSTVSIPIVWTQHDCWAFTGGCTHFTLNRCYKWKEGGCVQGCPIRQGYPMRRLFEKTSQHYLKKKRLITLIDDMTLVPVSHWLERHLKHSFLRCHDIHTIRNGVDVTRFYPHNSLEVREKYGIGEGPYVIGVSSVWSPFKGWNDFLQLSSLLPKGIKLIMVGLNAEQLVQASKVGIIGIPRTNSIVELAELYSGAIMTLNLSGEESFGLTTVEGMACGTPGVVYNATASPELIVDDLTEIPTLNLVDTYVGRTGWIVKYGDIQGVSKIIQDWLNKIYFDTSIELEMRRRCRERAVKDFNIENQFAEYIRLYDTLLRSGICG